MATSGYRSVEATTRNRFKSSRKLRRREGQLKGGFECNFVIDPPEHLLTECSVCLCVLREPVLVDCCGNSFCRSCIEPIKAERKPCPLCAVHFTGCMPDKRLQRTLNEMQVYCSHKEEGCEWVGKLANLEPHLNVSPPLSEIERLLGCQLTSLECRHCGECFKRRDLEDHETNACPQRPYICEYCRDYRSTFEDVIWNHQKFICSFRPVPCPNGCGSSPKFKLVNNHLKKCPLKEIECPFSYVGCSQKVSCRDMPNHIAQSVTVHMSLMATHHREEVRKLNQRVNELETQLGEAKDEVAELRRENKRLVGKVQQECKVQVEAVSRELKTAQEQRLKGHLGTLRGEIKRTQAEVMQEVIKQVNSDITALHSHVGLVPFHAIMPGFEQKKRSDETWYSPSFYTHPCGYRMCLRVDANGYGVGESSHVSVFVCMMKGEYDVGLKWPFRGDITVQLLDQEGDHNGHLTRVFSVERGDAFGDRAVEEERSVSGLGFEKFIRHASLTPSFLKVNCLKLCVKEVKLAAPL